MSGGVAYVLDEAGDFHRHCNQEMVLLERLEDVEEINEVERMLRRHAQYTNSERARLILARWEELVPRFVKVMPKDYKRVLEALERVTKAGLSGEEAIMAAFEANKADLARVSGN
jgi:glutamate synthase (ferredoxin)